MGLRFEVNLECEPVNTIMGMLGITLLSCMFCMTSFFLSCLIFSSFSIWPFDFKKKYSHTFLLSNYSYIFSFSKYSQLLAAFNIFKCITKVSFSQVVPHFTSFN